jgi:hypothetical protein
MIDVSLVHTQLTPSYTKATSMDAVDLAGALKSDVDVKVG